MKRIGMLALVVLLVGILAPNLLAQDNTVPAIGSQWQDQDGKTITITAVEVTATTVIVETEDEEVVIFSRKGESDFTPVIIDESLVSEPQGIEIADYITMKNSTMKTEQFIDKLDALFDFAFNGEVGGAFTAGDTLHGGTYGIVFWTDLGTNAEIPSALELISGKGHWGVWHLSPGADFIVPDGATGRWLPLVANSDE